MGMKLAAFLLAPWALLAQGSSGCDNSPAYSPCEMVFDLSGPDAAAHPNPYLSVQLRIEFRSPRQRTLAMPAFWDGGGRMVVRFSPTEAGKWDYHVTSNIAAWNDRAGSFTAAASDAPGFIRPAELRHWAYTERNLPHLWMGATELRFAFLGDADFRAVADARAAQKFNHLRGLAVAEGLGGAYQSADSPSLYWFQRLDQRVRYLNQKGLAADLILASRPAALVKLFPGHEQRLRFARYLAARYAAFNVTWQGVQEFESDPNARSLLQELGNALRDADPYQHPRSSGARITSAPFLDDRWMDFIGYGPGADSSVGAVEHQLYGVPFVNFEFAREDSGAGKSGPQDLDAAAFRHRLWNATMDGQYPTYANTGEGSQYLNSPGARAMTVWFDFFSGTRHWEMEPYFDVDGGRALALEDTDYMVYIEKPGPVELTVVKHSYDVIWMNPADGSVVKQKKSSTATISPASRPTARTTGCCAWCARARSRAWPAPTGSNRAATKKTRRRCPFRFRRSNPPPPRYPSPSSSRRAIFRSPSRPLIRPPSRARRAPRARCCGCGRARSPRRGRDTACSPPPRRESSSLRPAWPPACPPPCCCASTE